MLEEISKEGNWIIAGDLNMNKKEFEKKQ